MGLEDGVNVVRKTKSLEFLEGEMREKKEKK
jgi:hypothetical protein